MKTSKKIKQKLGNRYIAKPFSQSLFGPTLYAVWDNKTENWVIENNGLVAINPNLKEAKIGAKYLNDNLSYEPLLDDKPFGYSKRIKHLTFNQGVVGSSPTRLTKATRQDSPPDF